jgi:hypothetical protein
MSAVARQAGSCREVLGDRTLRGQVTDSRPFVTLEYLELSLYTTYGEFSPGREVEQA